MSSKHNCSIGLGVALCLSLSGCSQLFYQRLPTGQFTGRLIIQWIEPNQFVYLPDPDKPLRYKISETRSLEPQKMFTDGGSIPRLFWSAPGLGPWDFAPAYIIHDWLFEQHHCQKGNWQEYSFDDSAQILAEAIKTQMTASKGYPPEPDLVWAIYQAVRTPIAKNLWEHGLCKPAAAALPPGSPTPNVVTIGVIDFGAQK
jgi:hypothetical protein